MYANLNMAKHFRKICLSLLLVAIPLALTSGIAMAQYLTNGHFPTANLKWCHSGQYYSENLSASAQWGWQTDLNLTSNCSGTDVRTFGYNMNQPGLAGFAYICSGSTCGLATNSPYWYCEARSNTGVLHNWSFSERKFNGMHELGHCWSLAHRNDSNSVLRTGKHSIPYPNSTDVSLVNARH